MRPYSKQKSFVLLNGRKRLHPYLVGWFRYCRDNAPWGSRRGPSPTKRGPGRRAVESGRNQHRPSKIARILRGQRWTG